MPLRRFIQTDVFTATPTRGNGLAVVLDGEGLSDDQMQQFAAWTNLAETTFLLAPEDPAADYRVRIFTPNYEMPFAGHPTLGSCAAWLHAGGVPKSRGRVVQQCQIGLVEIDLSGSAPAFAAPPTEIRPLSVDTLGRSLAALGLSRDAVVNAVELSNGPVWSLLELRDAQTVLDIDASRVSWPEHVALGVVGAHPTGTPTPHGADFEVRHLVPSSGMLEDPITGSLNAAIAKWLDATGRLTASLVMRQGTRIGRDGRVFIRKDGDRILIGGQSHIVIDGTVDL